MQLPLSVLLTLLLTAAPAAALASDVEKRVPVDSTFADPCGAVGDNGKALCTGCFSPTAVCVKNKQWIRAQAFRGGFKCPAGSTADPPKALCFYSGGAVSAPKIFTLAVPLATNPKLTTVVGNQCCSGTPPSTSAKNQNKKRQTDDTTSSFDEDEELAFDAYFEESSFSEDQQYVFYVPPAEDDSEYEWGDELEWDAYEDGQVAYDESHKDVALDPYAYYVTSDGDDYSGAANGSNSTAGNISVSSTGTAPGATGSGSTDSAGTVVRVGSWSVVGLVVVLAVTLV